MLLRFEFVFLFLFSFCFQLFTPFSLGVTRPKPGTTFKTPSLPFPIVVSLFVFSFVWADQGFGKSVTGFALFLRGSDRQHVIANDTPVHGESSDVGGLAGNGGRGLIQTVW